MSKPESIMIDDQKYVRADSVSSIQDKKLCVPLSEEELFTLIRNYVSAWEINISTIQQNVLATTIYNAQF